MSRPEILGVPLVTFAGPIEAALTKYSDIAAEAEADGVAFDIDTAMNLSLTPDKPYSALSASPMRYCGEIAGTLYVIAFKPGDGTGDENSYELRDLDVGGYPNQAAIVP